MVSTYADQANPRALNKLAWEKKDGRRAVVGSVDGRTHVYVTIVMFRPKHTLTSMFFSLDIGDLALTKEADWDATCATFHT